MLYLIKHYDDYDETQLGIPWGAPCKSNGKPNFGVNDAIYTGDPGKAGDLCAEDPVQFEIWKAGQRNYNSDDRNMFYVQFYDGAFHPLPEDHLLDALNAFFKDKDEVSDSPEKQGASEKKEAGKGKKRKRAPANAKNTAPKNKGYVLLQLKLSPEEHDQIKQNAARAGMSPTALCKQQALRDVKSIDLTALIDHTNTLGRAVEAINSFVAAPHPDRWLYQADLEHIEDKLGELLTIENQIHQCIRKKMKEPEENNYGNC